MSLPGVETQQSRVTCSIDGLNDDSSNIYNVIPAKKAGIQNLEVVAGFSFSPKEKTKIV